ncbi:MAG: hypothetical protein O3A00_00740, partial [Planctomycetota bacterium]|nr:hypothetical protein [Planctomycetota bacterium]
MTAFAHFFADVLQSLALRADTLPGLDVTDGLHRFSNQVFSLGAIHSLLVGLSHRALRMDSRSRVADCATDRAALVPLARNQRIRLFFGHGRHASYLGIFDLC